MGPSCELKLILPSPAPPPDCVPVEVSYTCGGNPAAGSVALQSSYSPMPTVGGGSFFANSNCTGSVVTSVVSPALTIGFRPAYANGRPLVGQWLLTGHVNGLTTPTVLLLQGEIRAPETRLQVGVCRPLATPTFTGRMTSTPVAYWTDISIGAFAGAAIVPCSGSTVVIPASMTSPTVPSVRVDGLLPGVSQVTGTEIGTAGVVFSAIFDITTCMGDGGSVFSSSDCCGSSTTLSDGGLSCP